MARYARLVVYDRRGMGMSDETSAGALIVFAYALAYPENVDRILLMNPSRAPPFASSRSARSS
jgi:pimeloyl-ACP methyl ester carboxylesterase